MSFVGGRGRRWFVGLLSCGALALSCADEGDVTPCPGASCACDGGLCPDAACPLDRQCAGACCAEAEACVADLCELREGPVIGPGGECLYIPGPGEFEAPELSWFWPFTDATATARREIELPEFTQVMSTPTVVKLHGGVDPNERPAVIFGSYRSGGSENIEGVLRVLNGDGTPRFTVTDPQLRINAVSSPAVGDLDGDGEVEIVVGAWDAVDGLTAGLIAFRSDGTLLWRTRGLNVGWGGPALAELDGVPPAEVVIGSAVLDGATGRVRCDGGYTARGDNGVGPLSVVADIDGDGRLEIVGGSMAYRLELDRNGKDVCRRLWHETIKDRHGNRLWDGFPAVADIYDDPNLRTTQGVPEIAVVSHGFLRVHDWTGGLLMNPVPIPGGGLGGPPTIADFDGDGQAEIGVASISSYTVFKPGRPGNRLWTVPTQDISSSTTGSSVFDFDGNGRAEVVYADECYLHVYDGATGLELFQAPNTSCTAYELPVIADVDGDGAAELLVAANSECSIECPYGSHRSLNRAGLQAFRSPSDNWVASRPVWNQHGYHVTNIGDSGQIPLVEARSWGPQTLNSFRQNYQGDGVFAAPNLRVTRTRLDGDQCPTALRLFAEIENAGSRGVRAGLPIAFYEETDSGRVLVGVVTLPDLLLAGAKAEVVLEWVGPPRLHPLRITAVADDDGAGLLPKGRHRECDETDNGGTFSDVVCREAG